MLIITVCDEGFAPYLSGVVCSMRSESDTTLAQACALEPPVPDEYNSSANHRRVLDKQYGKRQPSHPRAGDMYLLTYKVHRNASRRGGVACRTWLDRNTLEAQSHPSVMRAPYTARTAIAAIAL